MTENHWRFNQHVKLSFIATLITIVSQYIFRLLLLMVPIFWSPHEAASIAIIGGADGPTAIYTTIARGDLLMLIGQAILIFLTWIALYKPISKLLKKVKN